MEPNNNNTNTNNITHAAATTAELVADTVSKVIDDELEKQQHGADDEMLPPIILSPPYSEPSIERYREGKYVQLTHGWTYYQLFEPELIDQSSSSSSSSDQYRYKPRLIRNLSEKKYTKQTKVVLCLHGITHGSISFHNLVQPLVNQGYFVLLFDFYGRGKSDAPDIPYSLDTFLSQAIDLLDHLKIDNIYLIGYSMGGFIGTYFAATHPQRLIKLGLLGPAIIPVPVPLVARLVTLNYVGKFLFKMFGAQTMLNRLERERLQNDFYQVDKIHPNIIEDLVQKGTKDLVIPFETAQNFMKQYLPHARVETLETGHSMMIEKQEETMQLLIQFLNEPL
eukprot:gene7437-9141_t